MYTVFFSVTKCTFRNTAIFIPIRRSNHLNGFVERANTVKGGKNTMLNYVHTCIYIYMLMSLQRWAATAATYATCITKSARNRIITYYRRLFNLRLKSDN